MIDLVEHMERRLGRMRSGWSRDVRGHELGFQVAEFRGGGQLEGSTSYATIGLSEHKLTHPRGGTPVAMELVMTVHSAQAPARLPQAVQSIARMISRSHEALLRGQVEQLPGALTEGSDKSFVYAAIPGYFDEEFDTFELMDGSEAVIVWLVPVSRDEGRSVAEFGWPSFERAWEVRDPDLLDLFRPSIGFGNLPFA